MMCICRILDHFSLKTSLAQQSARICPNFVGELSCRHHLSVRMSKRCLRTNGLYSCQLIILCDVHGIVCRAQPAIINRQAMKIMQPAIEFTMLSKLQKLWGSSHDVILGMLLWMHDLPAIPLHSVMHYCPITHHILLSGALQEDPMCRQVLIYHKVRCS